MLRLALTLLMLALTGAAELPSAPPLRPSTAFHQSGPASAAGVLVWLHGSYDTDIEPAPPPEPAWVSRLAARGVDIWRFDRAPGQDRLEAGGAALARGLAGLREAGYRRVMVAGHSRGAFIALSALAHPDLADAVAAISPAAHGTSPARRAQAMADFTALLHAATGRTALALALLDDDPLEPDADRRGDAARTMAARTGARLLLIDRPDEPRGHMGGYDTAFDRLFGEQLARFLVAE